MKPASVIAFGRLWLLSIVLCAVGAWVSRQRVQAMLEANPQSASVAHWVLPTWTGLLIAASLFLGYLIGHRSLTAKWLVLLFAIGSAARGLVAAANFVLAENRHPVSSLAVLATSLATIAAAAMLFRPDAKLWFGEDGADDELQIDPEWKA